MLLAADSQFACTGFKPMSSGSFFAQFLPTPAPTSCARRSALLLLLLSLTVILMDFSLFRQRWNVGKSKGCITKRRALKHIHLHEGERDYALAEEKDMRQYFDKLYN